MIQRCVLVVILSAWGINAFRPTIHRSIASVSALFARKPLVDIRQLEPNDWRLLKTNDGNSKWSTVDFDVPSTMKGCVSKFAHHPTTQLIVGMLSLLIYCRVASSFPLTILEVQYFTGTLVAW